jgi:hypothetical protein
VKRILILSVLALTGGLALAATAGATEDLSLHSAPGVPHIGEAVCTPTGVVGTLTCRLPVLSPAQAPGDVALPAVAVEGGRTLRTGAAEAAGVATAKAAEPDVYGARLQAQLCASRTVFCDVDQSGHYRLR